MKQLVQEADKVLGGCGFPNKYGRLYADLDDPFEYKVDCNKSGHMHFVKCEKNK